MTLPASIVLAVALVLLAVVVVALAIRRHRGGRHRAPDPMATVIAARTTVGAVAAGSVVSSGIVLAAHVPSSPGAVEAAQRSPGLVAPPRSAGGPDVVAPEVVPAPRSAGPVPADPVPADPVTAGPVTADLAASVPLPRSSRSAEPTGRSTATRMPTSRPTRATPAPTVVPPTVVPPTVVPPPRAPVDGESRVPVARGLGSTPGVTPPTVSTEAVAPAGGRWNACSCTDPAAGRGWDGGADLDGPPTTDDAPPAWSESRRVTTRPAERSGRHGATTPSGAGRHRTGSDGLGRHAGGSHPGR